MAGFSGRKKSCQTFIKLVVLFINEKYYYPATTELTIVISATEYYYPATTQLTIVIPATEHYYPAGLELVGAESAQKCFVVLD